MWSAPSVAMAGRSRSTGGAIGGAALAASVGFGTAVVAVGGGCVDAGGVEARPQAISANSTRAPGDTPVACGLDARTPPVAGLMYRKHAVDVPSASVYVGCVQQIGSI